jgi:hypothetical protein
VDPGVDDELSRIIDHLTCLAAMAMVTGRLHGVSLQLEGSKFLGCD